MTGNVTMNNGRLLTLSNTGVGTQYLDTITNNTLRLFSYGPNNGGQILFQANATTVGAFNSDGLTVTGNASVSKTLTAAAFSGPSLTAAAATALVLGAGGSEKVRIDTNGNVGIGNSAPAHTLAVNGTGYVSGQLIASNHSVTGATTYLNATGLSVVTPNPDGTQYGMIGVLQRGGAGNVGLTLSQAGVSSYGILHPNGGGLTFVDNRYPSNLGGGGSGATGTERMRIDTAGNVGIATSAASGSRLQIGTTAQTSTPTPERLSLGGTYSNAAGANPKLLLFQGSTTYGMGVSADRLDYMVPTNASHVFYVNAAEKMRIHTTGNVGIGTTLPAYQLQLSTDSAAKPTTSTWTIASDRRVKLNIETANADLCYSTVKNLPLRRYTYDPAVFPDDAIHDRSVVGWIAQEVREVLPKAVSQSSQHGYDDFLSLDADQIYKTMYGALQRVIADKEALEARVALLEVMRQP